MGRNRTRNVAVCVYINGVPCWECPVCCARFAASVREVADAHVRRCRALHR